MLAVVGMSGIAGQPNILFILTDDLGYGDVGVFFQNMRQAEGKGMLPAHFTPHIDKIAVEGTQLRRYYCAAPVCAPSRATILLGVHQGHANVRDNQFDKALEHNHTLGTVLKSAGYATVAIGKWGLQGKGEGAATWPSYPTKCGFDDYYGYIRHGDGHEHYPKEGLYRDKKEVWWNDKEVSDGLDKCYTADLFTARAKQWIIDHQTARPKQPFFMYLAYDTPHAVLELPTQAYPKGAGLKGGLKWLGEAGHMINTASGKIDSFYHPDYAKAVWDHDGKASTPPVPWPDVYKRFATSVRRIDDAVGDLRQLLKDLGIEEDTLVVFTSDNGPSKESYLKENYEADFFDSYGPNDGIKRDTLEGGIRVGAMAAWPGVIRTRRVSELPCSATDWMATFADAAGVEAPARTDGVSLMPLLTGTGKQVSPTVYIEYFQNGRSPGYKSFAQRNRNRMRGQMQAITLDGYQGLRYDIKSPGDPFEIYRVEDDPHQTNNLAKRPEFAGLEQRMRERVLQVRRPDSDAPRPYDNVPMPPVDGHATTNGFVEFSVYKGTWPWVPDFSSMTSIRTGRSVGLDLSVVEADSNYGVAFGGFITAPRDGEYEFQFESDSGGHFRIHDATVIDDDFDRSGGPITASVVLAAGRHPFRLYYRHESGPAKLSLKWSGPGFELRELAAQDLSVGDVVESKKH